MPITHSRFVAHAAISALLLAAPIALHAQGCEPIRFTVPISLGGEGEAYQRSGEWRLTIAYRRLHADQWFVGHDQADNLAPGGSAPVFQIHTAIVDLAYAFNDRFRARISVPFNSGSFSRTWADGLVHEQSVSGIGDISVQGEAWLLEPRTHEQGNVAIGLGVKAPTGSHDAPSKFYLASGAVDFPADQTVEPGDGGWGILTQIQAFRRITERTSLYAFGSYMISPRDQTEIKGAPAPAPNSTLPWSVPDVYDVRAGLAFTALPDQGLSLSLGLRVDGIPVHDLVGGGDVNTIKRTSQIVFVEPGLSWTRGRDNITLSVPWRVSVDRMKSLTEQLPGALPNGGGFAQSLLFLSYSRRL